MADEEQIRRKRKKKKGRKRKGRMTARVLRNRILFGVGCFLFVALIVFLISALLNRVNTKKIDSNTIIVRKNGKIIEVACENYSDTKIKAEELVEYVDKQIKEYNDKNGNVIKKKSIDVEDMSKVKLVLVYDDIDAFNGFNLLECTLDNYTNVTADKLTGKFKDADGKDVDLKAVDGKKAKVLIYSQKGNVILPKKVLYYNDEVTVKDDKITTSGKDNAVIIF